MYTRLYNPNGTILRERMQWIIKIDDTYILVQLIIVRCYILCIYSDSIRSVRADIFGKHAFVRFYSAPDWTL